MLILTIEDLIARDEGLSLKAAKDSVGYVIGYGRNVMTEGISEDEAKYLMANDIAAARVDCATLPFWDQLSAPRQGVLISMHYEMGFHGMLSFRHMLGLMAEEKWNEAADELLNSDYVKEVPDRAHRLALQLREDRWV